MILKDDIGPFLTTIQSFKKTSRSVMISAVSHRKKGWKFASCTLTEGIKIATTDVLPLTTATGAIRESENIHSDFITIYNDRVKVVIDTDKVISKRSSDADEAIMLG